MLPEIFIKGCGFSHSTSSTLYEIPKYFKWNYHQPQAVNFFADNSIQEGVRSELPNKHFWLIESRDVIPNAIQFVRENHKLVSENCRYLFTHCRDIVELEPNFIFLPSHGTWIEEPQLYRKSKVVSLISSNKNWLAGHNYRLRLVEKFRGQADIFGRGICDFEKKEDVLAPYMFNICIENDNTAYGYFSEKILDCFATGTIPIYHGDPAIDRCFDSRGIIQLSDDFDIKSLTNELYASMLPYAEINLALTISLGLPEDNLWNYINV